MKIRIAVLVSSIAAVSSFVVGCSSAPPSADDDLAAKEAWTLAHAHGRAGEPGSVSPTMRSYCIDENRCCVSDPTGPVYYCCDWSSGTADCKSIV